MTTTVDTTMPDTLSTSLAFEALSSAIAATTDMVQLEDDPFSSQRPASANHRTFTITPGNGQYLGRMRADEADVDAEDRDVIIMKRQMMITIYHDLDHMRHDLSYQQADADLQALEDAVLCHADAFRILQPELGTCTVVRKGHTLMQTITITITTSRLLPPFQE